MKHQNMVVVVVVMMMKMMKMKIGEMIYHQLLLNSTLKSKE
jgi:hypothetical protein